MTDALAEFYNDVTGAPQLSSRFPSLVFSQKGTYSFTTNPEGIPGVAGGAGGYLALTIPDTSLLAWRPTVEGAAVTLAYVEKVSGVTRFHFVTNNSSTQVDWWVFDIASGTTPPSSGSIGIALYGDGAGSLGPLMWHLNVKPLVTIASVNKTMSSSDTAAQTVTEPSGRTYAAIQGMRSGYETFVAIPQLPDGSPDRYAPRYYMDCMYWSSSPKQVTVGPTLLEASPTTYLPQPATNYFSPRNFMVVDVTGL